MPIVGMTRRQDVEEATHRLVYGTLRKGGPKPDASGPVQSWNTGVSPRSAPIWWQRSMPPILTSRKSLMPIFRSRIWNATGKHGLRSTTRAGCVIAVMDAP